MAFPTVAGTPTTGNQTTNDNSTEVTYPSGIVSGERLLLILAHDGNPTISGWPSGWNVRESAPNGTAVKLTIAEKFADGTETGTFTLNLSANETYAWWMVRISGSHASEAAALGTAATGTSNAPNPPSLDPANWATEDTLWIAVYAYDNGQTTTTGLNPTNYTGGVNIRSNSTGGCGIAVARRELAASSEDPGTFTHSVATEEWRAQTIAIRPAPPGQTITRSSTESMGLGEAATPARVVRQSSSEATTLAEGAVPAETERRSLAEAEALAESASRSIGFARSVVEALGMGETPAQSTYTARAGVEALTPAESFSLSVYELIQRSIVEQPILTESGQQAILYRRSDAEGTGLTEAGSPASQLVRNAAESVAPQEVESRAVSVVREALEAAQLIESAEVRRDLSWSAVEAPAPVESGVAQGAGVQTQSDVEVVPLTEEAAYTLILSRTGGEGITISESGVAALIVSRSQAEIAGLLEEPGLAAWARIGAGIEGLVLLECAILRGGEPPAPFAGPTTAALIVAGATVAAPEHRGETKATVRSTETKAKVS